MEEATQWLNQPRTRQVLLSFSTPGTPTTVAKSLGIRKLKIAPFLQKKLLKSLNPDATKGTLYILTDKARRLLHLPEYTKETKTDWDILGWMTASPRQRYVVLKTLTRDSLKRTSEHIRHRAAPLNPCLSRISTKETLKELIGRGLVETEKGDDRRRYYWISQKGRSVVETIDAIAPIKQERECPQ